MSSKRKTHSGRAGSTGSTVKRAMRLIRTRVTGEETALDLLKSQHDEVKALFKKIQKTSARAQKSKLFEEMARKLVGHDAIEREFFYPACEKALGLSDLLGEALVEHGVVEFSLFQADQARQATDFSFKCQVLSELVLHHVEEEEEDLFPKVQRALGRGRLVQLGARMKARFEETQAVDFRPPLHKNLNQVLAGALKPGKRAPAKRRAA
jgi:hemerythrin superfamily protein